MANEKNLIPVAKRTKKEQREIARMGGKASGEVRRRKKTMKEVAEVILSLPLKDRALDDIDALMSLEGIKGKNITVQETMTIALIKKAMTGNLQAIKLMSEVMGELVEKQEVTHTADNSFMTALNGKAEEVWKNEKEK